MPIRHIGEALLDRQIVKVRFVCVTQRQLKGADFSSDLLCHREHLVVTVVYWVERTRQDQAAITLATALAKTLATALAKTLATALAKTLATALAKTLATALAKTLATAPAVRRRA